MLIDGTCVKSYTKFEGCAKLSRYRPNNCAFCDEGYNMDLYSNCRKENDMAKFYEALNYKRYDIYYFPFAP